MTQVNLSCTEKLDIVKTFIFPKFLFYLRTLPIAFLPNMLNLWQKQLNKFIWHNKAARIKHDTLFKPWSKVGIAYPKRKLHHKVAQLINVLKISQTTTTLDWTRIVPHLCKKFYVIIQTKATTSAGQYFSSNSLKLCGVNIGKPWLLQFSFIYLSWAEIVCTCTLTIHIRNGELITILWYYKKRLVANQDTVRTKPLIIYHGIKYYKSSIY